MKGNLFLRAYMAGVLLPTWILLLVLGAVVIAHLTGHSLPRLQSAIVFPMAVVPNVWGLWNLLYASMHLSERVSIGVFGALLPLALVPAGVGLAASLGLDFYSVRHAVVVLPVLMVVYYLAWKYAVAYFNRVVGVA